MWLESYGSDTRGVLTLGRKRKQRAQGCARTAGMDAGAPQSKNEIALLSTEVDSSAISESYEPPKRFVRWQPDWPGTSCQFVSRQAIGGRCLPVGTRLASVNITSLAGNEICFRESHIPCGVWCR